MINGEYKETSEEKDVPKPRVVLYARYSSIMFILLLVLFTLLVISTLKTLKIIPDPPETFDVTQLIMQIAGIVIGGFLTVAYRFFKQLKTDVDALLKSVDKINDELKNLKDTLDLSTRIARLEAKISSK